MLKAVSLVASKGRPDILSSHTLAWLVCSMVDWYVFVEPQEEALYRNVVPKDNLIVIDKNDQGLGYVKRYMGEWLRKSKYDVAMKLDDDIWTWHDRGSKKSPHECAEAYDEAIYNGVKAMEKYPDVGAFCYPYRNELYELKMWVAINRRLQTCYLIRAECWQGDPRVSTFEDFYNYIWLRVNNWNTLRYGLIGMDTDVGETKGGLQEFNRSLMAKDEVAVLRELYPALQFKRVEGKKWYIEPILKGGIFSVKEL